MKITEKIKGICPCGGEFTAGQVAEGEHQGAPVVLHDKPLCAKFEELEPDEFLTYVRQSYGIKAPWDDWN